MKVDGKRNGWSCAIANKSCHKTPSISINSVENLNQYENIWVMLFWIFQGTDEVEAMQIDVSQANDLTVVYNFNFELRHNYEGGFQSRTNF